MFDVLLRNPVKTASLFAILLNLAISFGLNLTAEQVALLNAALVGVLGLLVPSFTTSTAAPKLTQGTTVEVITPGTDPNPTTVL
jgi:BarA-like signal transduction histidine kinase